MKRSILLLGVVSCILFLSGCMTVPKETVELSYMIGSDLSSIKKSYVDLINTHFDLLEKGRMDYLENEWTPNFIKSWIEDGQLVNTATGKVVWSSTQGDFISPTKGMEEQELLSTVNFWSIAAIEEINTKKKDLIEPLEVQKKELLLLVDDAFDRLYRSNAAITSYLNSIRKIQEVQDETLKALNLTELQKEINQKMQDVSKLADESLQAVKKADGFIDSVESIKNK